MAIQFGQNIADFGGTGGGSERVWRDAETGGSWDYQMKPWDYSKVDFGEAPVAGGTPLIDAVGNFKGWQTPDGRQWAPNDQFKGRVDRGVQAETQGGWTGSMGQSIEGDNKVPGWMKYGTLGMIAAGGGYGALAASGALGAAGAASAAGGSGAATGAGGLTALGSGSVAPLTSAATIGEAGAAAGAAGAGAGGGSSFLSQLGTGAKYGSNALKLAGMLGLTGSSGAPGAMTRSGGGMPTQGGGSAPRNWLDQLLGVGAGVNSDIQLREKFTNLNDLFSRREEERAPWEAKLRESYDNPNAYLESPEYKALAGIRGNQLNREAAAKGRLANDVDREVLMQAHAQKALGDYRTGLRGALGEHQLPYNIFQEAQNANASRGAPTAGGLGYAGATKGILDLLAGSGVDPSTVSPGLLSQLGQLFGGGSSSTNTGGGGFELPGMGGAPGEAGGGFTGSFPSAGGFDNPIPGMTGGGWGYTDPTMDPTGGYTVWGGSDPSIAIDPGVDYPDFGGGEWIPEDIGTWFDW